MIKKTTAFIVAAALMLFPLSERGRAAFAIFQVSALVCPANDGSAGAPSGSPQQPTLLNTYTKTIRELGCKVAGVDYAVGYPSGTSLLDWQSISGIPGITVNTAGLTPNVRCDNTDNVTLDSINFSLHNGAYVLINNCNNFTVSKGLFGGTNYVNDTYLVQQTGTSTGLTVINSVLDGGGADGTSALIGAVKGGTIVNKYNWLKNCGQQIIAIAGNSTVDYRFNLIENCGQRSLAHLNYQQISSDTYTITTQFNTTNQQPQTGGAGEGFQWYANASGKATLTNPSFQYNTMIAIGASAMSYMVHGNCQDTSNCASTQSTISGSALINNNYFDITGAIGVFYPSSASNMWTGWTLSSNWNMSSGGAISNSP